MNVRFAVYCLLEYLRANSKKSTTKTYEILLVIFNRKSGDQKLEPITSDKAVCLPKAAAGGEKPRCRSLPRVESCTHCSP